VPSPLVIAHRGDSANRPENTLAAFASALELGAELVELDIQLTRDGHVVVIHDPVLDRTTTGQGPVRERTLAEIRALSAGYPERFGSDFAAERVPTLAEVLHLMRGRARTLLEIKHEAVTAADEDGIEALAIAEVRKAGVVEEVAFLSFARRALERCRQKAPEIPRGHIFFRAGVAEVLEGARAAGTDLVMPEKSMLSFELRDRVREAGLRLATWVVDEPEELRALAPYDLFGVGSNCPGLLLEALAEWGGEIPPAQD
jgi:glycerophosphoryl diester phosphodiesterase